MHITIMKHNRELKYVWYQILFIGLLKIWCIKYNTFSYYKIEYQKDELIDGLMVMSSAISQCSWCNEEKIMENK